MLYKQKASAIYEVEVYINSSNVPPGGPAAKPGEGSVDDASLCRARSRLRSRSVHVPFEGSSNYKVLPSRESRHNFASSI